MWKSVKTATTAFYPVKTNIVKMIGPDIAHHSPFMVKGG
jgi:hypothetical protein